MPRQPPPPPPHLPQVYLALWSGTPAAVKILLLGAETSDAAAVATAQQLVLSSPALAKLKDEAGLLASLRHPNIVSFYGVCHSPPCIVTE